MNSNDLLLSKKIQKTLRQIKHPSIEQDIVALNMVRNLEVAEGNASFTLNFLSPLSTSKKLLETQVRESLSKIPELQELRLAFSAEVQSGKNPPGPGLSEVKNVLAVASAKGGVGKSTVALNLAVALAAAGTQVGILDTDIYGPSLPTLLGLKNTPPLIDQKKKKMIPLEKFGLKSMSIGYLMREEDAAVWRGPMVGRMVQQFLQDVEWGELDYLVLDLPPGTGDIQLSLSQLLALNGAVMVTTPQELAVADVRRGIAMFEKVKVPILGILENMSYFICPHCQERSEIFSHGGGQKLAKELKLPFLGEIPIDPATRQGSDEGKPLVHSHPDSPTAHKYQEAAANVAEQLTVANAKQVKLNL